MIIDRYLLGELARPFLVVSLVLLATFTTFSLGRFLVDASAGLLKVSEVLQLTGLKALISLEVLLPLSFYLAVMIGLGRLYSDSEIYAMRACGISEKRLLQPIFGLAVVLALLIAAFSILVRPWAYIHTYQVKALAAASIEAERIKPAQFYVFDDPDRTVYVDRLSEDGSRLEGVFIQTRRGNDMEIITSPTGRFEYLPRPLFHRMKLLNAEVFKKVQDGPDLIARLASFTVWIPAGTPKAIEPEPEMIATGSLRLSTLPGDRAEYQWRFLTPVSTLLLALLAIPLSRSRPRAGRFARILLSLIVYAVYFSLVDISRSWVQQGTASTIWWVPGLLGLMVVAMYVPWQPILKRSFGTDAPD